MGKNPSVDHMHQAISYNFRALCSSHLQHPTHCAPHTPCAVEEGKEGGETGMGEREK